MIEKHQISGHEKSGRSYLPPRGIFAARRLTSEFGMGSGVSAWPHGRRWMWEIRIPENRMP